MEPIILSNGKIHTYRSAPNGFWVNSYIIETSGGLVVIDTQFILSEAKRLGNLAVALDKPLLAILITHPHPDHFNGTSELTGLGDQVGVFCTAATLQGIRETEAAKREYWVPVYKEDYPKATIFPNGALRSGEVFTIGGLNLMIEDIGVGETSNSSLFYLRDEGILFCADLAYHKGHPWLIEGHSEAWLKQLEAYGDKYKSVSTVLPGHGMPGTSALFEEQGKYITVFRDMVQRKMGTGFMVSDEDRKEIKNAMITRFPEFEFTGLIDMNITGIAGELAKQATT